MSLRDEDRAPRPPDALARIGLVLLAAVVFAVGARWGLPSHAADPWLFGTRTPWTGAQIVALAGTGARPADRGADVDLDPHAGTQRPFNATDADRAEIVRRYRLFTYQPDEMITLMALGAMKPSRGDFDPHLYQYGGLWIYPAALALKAAATVHLIDLRADVTFYLDHPEAFGRCYVVLRACSALWGIAGVLVVFALARRLSSDGSAEAAAVTAVFAGVAFVFLPVVVNAAHEAKPHLGGAVLMLAAAAALWRALRRDSAPTFLVGGALCGAATAMVLSAAPVFLLLVVAALRWRKRTAGYRISLAALALVIGSAVYALANPYVVLHLFWQRAVLLDNLHNSSAMYHVGDIGIGLLTAGRAVFDGAGAAVMLFGAIAGVLPLFDLVRKKQTDEQRSFSDGVILLAVLAGLVFVQSAAVGAGKPGEFGRFLLVPDIVLALAAVAGLSRCRLVMLRAGGLALLLIATMLQGGLYERGFIRDERKTTSRLQAAAYLKTADPAVLAVPADPAPYNMPPINLWAWHITRTPTAWSPSFILVYLQPSDRGPTRISWADKSFTMDGKPLGPSSVEEPPLR